VGPGKLWELSREPPADTPSLSLRELEARLADAKGVERDARFSRIADLFAAFTPPERALFVGALTGALRQGSLGGVMLLAVAERTGKSVAEVRRLVMLRGSVAAAAQALLAPSPDVATDAIELFRPIMPMLAATAQSIKEATEGLEEAQLEWKVDGVRAQLHKDGARVVIYSRQGNDITAGCSPLRAALEGLDAGRLVLDGEVVLVGPTGAARPFQDSFSTIASGGAPASGQDRLHVYFFDCLHRDGVDLLDAPLRERIVALAAVAPEAMRIPSARFATLEEAERFYAAALAAGSEGVLVKDLGAPYRFGARGRAWQKVKELTTVDLVVLAAEWGSGRREGLLSNLHLGALRDDGSFCMVGKTFKGLTDAMLRWQTERFEAIATERARHVVWVRPEVVVEVRFNDVQRSPRYPGGVALRFARVVRYREDKAASEIEPLASLVARVPGGAAAIGRPSGGRAQEAKKRQLSLFED
jgi:DNA ligase-1